MPVDVVDPRVAELVDPDAPIETLADGFATGEGPVWIEEESCLVFTDVGKVPGEVWTEVHEGRRWRWSEGAGAVLEDEPTNKAVGMARDTEGRLVWCEAGGRRVARREADGSTTVVADAWQGLPFSNPNDVVVRSDGSIWFTDSGARQAARPFHSVFRVTPDLDRVDLVARDFQLVNGLAFSPDESVLYVNDSHGALASPDFFYGQGSIRAYDVRDDGSLANSRLLCELRGPHSGVPDGMKVDARGNVYCTGPGGIWIIDPSGVHLGTLLTGVEHNRTNATNMAWGGPDLCTIFITTCSGLLRVRTNVPGLPAVPRPAAR